jgi:hypothetical protein
MFRTCSGGPDAPDRPTGTPPPHPQRRGHARVSLTACRSPLHRIASSRLRRAPRSDLPPAPPPAEAGKVAALVCHGTCVLLRVRLSSGELLVKDRTWTGFATSEEKIDEKAVGMKIQPFNIEDEARKLADTNFVVQAAGRPHAVRDGRLITGQQHFSAGVTAQLVIETLGR